MEENFNIEEAAKKFAETEEVVTQPASLGKAQKYQDVDPVLAGDIGWKNVPIENLPSQGLFYEDGTQVAIRAASVAEIRHWSTIDEGDMLSIDDMLNFIMEKCVRFKSPGKPSSFKDLKEIDRFYLVFAVRDYTFKNGENKMFANIGNDGEERVEITKDSISYFTPDERLMKYYDTSEKCFNLQMKNGENIKMYLPSLGVMMFIRNFVEQKRQKRQTLDKAFAKYAPFIFNDWKTLNQTTYEKASQESLTWSINKISVLNGAAELLLKSVNPEIRYVGSTGEESTAPLNFRGGIKSLFIIPDIFGELV